MAFAVRLLWAKTGDLGLGRLTGFALSVLCGALVYAVCVVVLRAETVKVLAGKLKKKEGAAS